MLSHANDRPFANSAAAYYISAIPLPGFVIADRSMSPRPYIYSYVRPGPIEKGFPVPGTIGTRTEAPAVYINNGGLINSWVSTDTGSADYEVDWVNRRGYNGRGLGGSLFIGAPNGDVWNPTWGGNYHDAQPDQETEETYIRYADGYSKFDMIQGSPIAERAFEDMGGGTMVARVTLLPLDFNPDGNKPAPGGLDKGGTTHDAIVYPDLPVEREVTVNFAGINGVHRFHTEVDFPGEVPANYSVFFESQQIVATWVWDEVHIYDSDTTTYTRLDNLNVWAGLSSPSISSVTGAGDVVTVTFSSGTGRTANTQHYVEMSGWAESPSINGLQYVKFTSSLVCTMSITSAAASYTGGSLNSYDIKYVDLDDRHTALFLADDHLVVNQSGGFINDDQTSTNKGRSLVSGGRCAMLIRALPSGGQDWSLDKDFAVGMYAKETDIGAEDTGRSRIQFTSFVQNTARTTPGGNLDKEAAIIQAPSSWLNVRPDPLPAGKVKLVDFYLTGTWDEVQANIAVLDGMSDASLDW